jgi:hypothetical protein
VTPLFTIDFGKLAYLLPTTARTLFRLRQSHHRISPCLNLRRRLTKMTSQSDLLQSYQPSFSLPSLPVVPETNPRACVFDSFRIAIAQLLSETLGLDVDKAYAGVDYGKKGEDFTVALPRFRLPGKVEDNAKIVTENVRRFLTLTLVLAHTLAVHTERIHRKHHSRQAIPTLPTQHQQYDSRRPHPST